MQFIDIPRSEVLTLIRIVFFIPGTSTSGVSTVNSNHGGGGHMHTSSSSQNFRELKSDHVRFFTELQDVQKSFQVRL